MLFATFFIGCGVLDTKEKNGKEKPFHLQDPSEGEEILVGENVKKEVLEKLWQKPLGFIEKSQIFLSAQASNKKFEGYVKIRIFGEDGSFKEEIFQTGTSEEVIQFNSFYFVKKGAFLRSLFQDEGSASLLLILSHDPSFASGLWFKNFPHTYDPVPSKPCWVTLDPSYNCLPLGFARSIYPHKDSGYEKLYEFDPFKTKQKIWPYFKTKVWKNHTFILDSSD